MSIQTILIVDDDTEIVEELSKNIAEFSDQYTVKTCDDGKKALEILETEKPDLVILDIQIPVVNGLQVLTELHNRGIWLPIIIITDANITEKDRKLRDFGIVDFIKKPFLPEKLVVNIDQMMKNRKKTDLIKNFSLPSILQLIEMEKRTGILTIKIGPEYGRIFFHEGRLMDISVKGLSTEDALETFINSLYEDREINIEYIDHKKDKKINMTLMQLVMEATRLKDERQGESADADQVSGNDHTPKNDQLLKTAEILNSLKEVEKYIIADAQGEVLVAVPESFNEEALNAGIYLWVTGDMLGNEFKFGEPSYHICYCKARKRLIRKYENWIIILELSEMTKYSSFKEKLNELLEKAFL